MATVEYNGVRMEDVNTINFQSEAVMDDTGLDYLCTRVTMRCVGVVHAQWWTTNKPEPLAGRGGPAGDRPGNFLYNVRKLLQEPRGLFVYKIGVDTVVECPELIAPGPAQGPDRFASDIMNGPFTKGVMVKEVIGDKSLIAEFTVVCHVNHGGSNNVLLSNRWDWQQDVDRHGFATVNIRGKAVLRKDFLDKMGLVADDFRSSLLPLPGNQMQRDAVSVRVSPDGATLHYQIVDKAVNFGFRNLGVDRMECVATSGMVGGNQSASGTFSAAVGLGKSVATRDVIGVVSNSVALVGNIAPRRAVSITARAYGRMGSDRRNLYRAAQVLAYSRLTICRQGGEGPGSTSFLWMTRFSCNMNWDSHGPPVVEFTLEFSVTMKPSETINGIIGPALKDEPPGLETTDMTLRPLVLFPAHKIAAAANVEFALEPNGTTNLDAGSKWGGSAGDFGGTAMSIHNPAGSARDCRAVRSGRAFAQALSLAGLADGTPPPPRQEITQAAADALANAAGDDSRAVNDRTYRTDVPTEGV